MINVLLIANELKYTCGVTNHLLHLSRGLTETANIKLWIICGGGNGIKRFNNINAEVIADKRFLHKGRNLTGYFSAITYLAKFVRKNKIDILHSHTHYAANLAANASRIVKAATAQTNHGILQNKGRLKHFNAQRYIAINEHIQKYLLSNGIAEENEISFIRCGIPVNDKPIEKPAENINVIAASRFNYEKGLDIYVNAVSLLDKDTKSKAEFFIAGEGELENSLKELNSKSNAGIKFLGSVKDIYAILNISHIFVYPTRSKSEGFPAIITEAGACNSLVISSRFNGSEGVMNSDEVLFFESDDIKKLAELLNNSINNYEDYKPYALRFYNKVKAEFDLETMITKHIELYSEMLNGR